MSRYTDAEMLFITQVAYLDVPYYQAGNRYTLDQIIFIKEQELRCLETSGTLTKAQQAQLDTIENLKSIAEKEHIDYHNWRIRDVRDHESGSGMYACLVDTGNGDAVVGFRGSESIDGEQIWKDWGQNDFGLLNNTLTPQQGDAQEYTRYLYEKYGKDYEHFNFSGHSLGGNLAEHASLTAPETMQQKIDRTINFDGPGFSEEYLLAHGDDISKHGHQIDHYQWSVVGTLLLPVPGSCYRIIDADMPEGGDMPGFLLRHGTWNVNFNRDGSVRDGQRDFASTLTDPISKGVELYNTLKNPMHLMIPLILYVENVMGNAIEDIQAVVSHAREQIRDWIRKQIGTGSDGEYEVNPMALTFEADVFRETARQVCQIWEEVERIRHGLKYDGLAGFYYKNKLGLIMNRIEADASKCEMMGGILQQCAQDYTGSDQVVAELYQEI